MNFKQLIEKRRSIYVIGDKTALSDTQITQIMQDAVKYCPTAFNSQSGRLVLLFKESHKILWDIVLNALRLVTPAERLVQTEAKIASFVAGKGTVLYYIDTQTTKDLQEKFPLYADKFPVWAEQAVGILQFIVWTALAQENIGASLQHYNPLIDEQVAETFQIPKNWKLTAQMPFGDILQPAGEKTFLSLQDRIKVFK
jgi:uncharacterized protein